MTRDSRPSPIILRETSFTKPFECSLKNSRRSGTADPAPILRETSFTKPFECSLKNSRRSGTAEALPTLRAASFIKIFEKFIDSQPDPTRGVFPHVSFS